MTNDITTLNGALQELSDTLKTNLNAKGVSTSNSDGLTTLANKINNISVSEDTGTLRISIALTGIEEEVAEKAENLLIHIQSEELDGYQTSITYEQFIQGVYDATLPVGTYNISFPNANNLFDDYRLISSILPSSVTISKNNITTYRKELIWESLAYNLDVVLQMRYNGDYVNVDDISSEFDMYIRMYKNGTPEDTIYLSSFVPDEENEEDSIYTLEGISGGVYTFIIDVLHFSYTHNVIIDMESSWESSIVLDKNTSQTPIVPLVIEFTR